MANPKTPPPPRSVAPTTPEAFPTTSPQPSGDYTYTLEVVMGMQKTLGELTQAVRTLTDQVKEHSTKLEGACRDIHAAKIALGVIGVIVLSAASVLGFIAKAAIDYFSRIPAK